MIGENHSKLFEEAPQLAETDQHLVDAYKATARPLDDLPYTEDFDRLVAHQRQVGDHREPAEIFKRLLNLRKAGRMPRIGRISSPVIPLSEGEVERLYDLIAFSAGTVGQRDRLPYTAEFDRLVEAFNRETGRQLSRHDVWRLVARIAK